MSKHAAHVFTAALLLIILASCDTGPTDPKLGPDSVRLDVKAADGLLVACGQEIPVQVRARKGSGRPVRDFVVNFNVLSGGGSIFAGSAATNQLGLAMDYWTIGGIANMENTLAVRAVDPFTGERKTYFEQTVVTGSRIAWTAAPSIRTALPDLSDERWLADGFDPAWSPDGAYIAYASSPDVNRSDIWVVAAGDPEARVKLTDPALFTSEYLRYDRAEDPDWSPDGRWIAVELPVRQTGDYLGWRSQIALVEANAEDGYLPEVRILGPGFDPVWAADGGRLLITTGHLRHGLRRNVAILSADGEGVTTILSSFRDEHDIRWVGYYQADWSPDGDYIVVVREDTDAGTWGVPGVNDDDWGGHSAIHIANVNGTGIRRITPYMAHAQHPRWSPDGGWILYERLTEDRGDTELWRVRPDGSEDQYVGGPWYTDLSTAAPDWSGCVGPW